MVIVDNAWQRRGIGKQLFRGLLQALEGRDVMLQATAQGRPLYESLGFAAIGHARQFHGHWQPPVEAGPTFSLATDELTRPLQPQDLPALLAGLSLAPALAEPLNYNLLKFSETASRTVPNNWMTVRLKVSSTHANPAQAAAETTRRLNILQSRAGRYSNRDILRLRDIKNAERKQRGTILYFSADFILLQFRRR